MPEREPRYPRIIFGDGTTGLAIKQFRKKDLEGTELIEFKIRPTRQMQEYYGISDEKLDHMGCITRAYPRSLVKKMNDDPLMSAIFVKCTFEWGDTSFTIEDEHSHIIEHLQTQNKRLKETIFVLSEEIRLMGSRSMERWKNIREEEKLIRGKEDEIPSELLQQLGMGGGEQQ